jgi:hypothetical protein
MSGMRNPVGCAVMVILVVACCAPLAVAQTPMTFGRGKVAVQNYVVYHAPTGYRRGSLLIACSRHSPFEIGCDVGWVDTRGHEWAGNIKARKLRSGHVRLIKHVSRCNGCLDSF